MSYHTLHTYGYGIKTSDIPDISVEKLQALIHLAPTLEIEVNKWFKSLEIESPTYQDYMDFTDNDYYLQIATFLQAVILEKENIEFTACDDINGDIYLLYEPTYPWRLPQCEACLTEQKIQEILKRYVAVITDEYVPVEYYNPENGG